MTMLSRPRTRFITFYSYKGGTGRSMALANVAWILASNGRRVLVIDWDLEAPGLHRYFRPFLADPDLKETAGLIDFVIAFANTTLTPADAPLDSDWYVPHADITEYACSLDWKFPDRGTIDFIGAGRQDSMYARRVNSFSWQSFYEKMGGEKFFDAARQHLIDAKYDYVLIDSRTGVSDTSGICTIEMPDSLVVCFTLNNQGIQGAAQIVESVQQHRSTDEGFRMFPVPMRVDPFEKERMDRRLAYAREKFAGLGQSDAYWSDVEVPYVPYYAYEEILAAFGDVPSRLNTSLASFERLTAHISDKDVTRLNPPAADARARILSLFSQTTVETKAVPASTNSWTAAIASVTFVAVLLLMVAFAFRTQSSTMSKQARWNALVQLAEERVERDPLSAALLLEELPEEADVATDVARKVLGKNFPSAVIETKRQITTINFDRDGNMIVAGHLNGTTTIWDADRSSSIAELYRHNGAVRSASFDFESQRIVTTGDDGTIRSWNLTGGQREAIPSEMIARTCHWNDPGDTTLFAASPVVNGGIAIAVRQAFFVLRGLCDPGATMPANRLVVRAVFSDNGERAIVQYGGGEYAIADLTTGTPLLQATGKKPLLARAVSVARDGARAVIYDYGPLLVLSTADGSIIQLNPTTTAGGAFDPSGSFVVGALQDGLAIYDAITGKILQSLPFERDPSRGLLSPAYSAYGQVASPVSHPLWPADPSQAQQDTTIFVWNVKRPEVQSSAPWHELRSAIRQRTRACLTKHARMQLLSESDSDAASRSDICHATYGGGQSATR